MRMESLLFFGRVKTGTDALGNDTYREEQIHASQGRFSSWTDKEVALDNRNVTTNARKVITYAKRANFATATAIKINNKYHDIKEIKGDDFARWRIVIVSEHGRDVL